MSKKGQVWSLDFVVALVIFSIALYFFYSYGSASLDTQNEEIGEMQIQAEKLSQNLISSGYPTNWTNSTVISIGLTDGNTRLDPNKVLEFSKINYQHAKNSLSTKYDFQITFRDRNNQTLNILGEELLGKNISLEDPANIIPTKRFLFYNSEIISMEVLIW
jgi:hypothetical protein